MSPTAKPKKLGLNLGPKTSAELAGIGIRTLSQLKKVGWQKAMLKLVTSHPERLNLNMIAALIGACASKDWRKLTMHERHEARQFIKEHKPKKKTTPRSPQQVAGDLSFVAFIVEDQLAPLGIEARRMFGGHGLYSGTTFFGLIANGVLFFKTSDTSLQKYIEAGMEPFQPKPGQVLKRYYQVPVDVLENAKILQHWAKEAVEC